MGKFTSTPKAAQADRGAGADRAQTEVNYEIRRTEAA